MEAPPCRQAVRPRPGVKAGDRKSARTRDLEKIGSVEYRVALISAEPYRNHQPNNVSSARFKARLHVELGRAGLVLARWMMAP